MNNVPFRIWLSTLVLMLGTARVLTDEPNASTHNQPVAPTYAYDARELCGWRLLVSPELIQKTNLCADTMRVLRSQLNQITSAVPPPALSKLRDIPIWVELNDKLFPCMCYHEDIRWLRGHGVNPDKTHAVELANAKNFLTWTRDQPWMVLHELAHGYYQRVVDGDERIRKCFEHARSEKLYDSVLRNNGKRERHYAMNNEKEYFAEMSEAFFGTNDFFPFVRGELKEHDPNMFRVLLEVWGTNSPGRSQGSAELGN